ncbi:CDP-alcohol phosphatidyltransferase family protein [Adlercreutzia shanghongiae]|uniref:CDP-alcohol phosphatidyltransferase family protein n=1 Tax=Adlercreutzia shanghongiae TaxID=3111773 RepID=A0ABU6IWT3_9ACTN|nr:CDP-alcohol phosphatidyltransferase family protein [Adlercreutzia sp. R22]MEC4294302.1 CDP-alcohol phosphatidyltransferase family protein [Adlercreutzia sp. R22]
MADEQREKQTATEQVTSEIFTAANVVSFVRLLLVPVYLWLLLAGCNLAATLVFAAAAASDFIDGQLARRTHTVSRLGQILDPAVDRILMVTGVLGVFLVGRIPLWVIVLVVLRDAYLLIGGAWLLSCYHLRVPVVYPGKFATTFLFVGFAGLLLNCPLIPGLGWCDLSWLPGFNGADVSWGIWFVYAGLVLSLGVTVYYSVTAARALAAELARERRASSEDSQTHGAA